MSPGPHPAAPAGHRHAAGDRELPSGPPAPLAPGILLPSKDHRQGRACGASHAMAQAPPLPLIFHGKTSAPNERNGRGIGQPDDVAAYGKPDIDDVSDEKLPVSLDTRQAAEDALRRAAGALVFANADDPAVQELQMLYDAVAPIILSDNRMAG
jgi:hypothetical protein